MRTPVRIALLTVLASCSAEPPAPAVAPATPGDQAESARIACMMDFEEDGGPQAFPSPEAYERALARCIEDELSEEI